MLSSQYGWQTDYIMTLTTREIDWRIRSINNRIRDDYKAQAALHGVQLKDNKSNSEVIKKLTPKEEENLQKIINSRLKGKHHGR